MKNLGGELLPASCNTVQFDHSSIPHGTWRQPVEIAQQQSDSTTRAEAMERFPFVEASLFEIHLDSLLSSGAWEGLVYYISLWSGGSEKVALWEINSQFRADRNVQFYSSNWADGRVGVSANTKDVESPIAKSFTPDVIKKEAVIWGEAQDFGVSTFPKSEPRSPLKKRALRKAWSLARM